MSMHPQIKRMHENAKEPKHDASRLSALKKKSGRSEKKRKYDRWNNDPNFSIAGSRRQVKADRKNQSNFTTPSLARQLWKSKHAQNKGIDTLE